MFEVVAEVLNMRTLELGEVVEIGEMKTLGVIRDMSDVNMLDIAQMTLDVDEQKLEVGPKGPRNDIRRKDNTVDGCNDIASRRRITVIDIVGRIMVVDNEICLKYGFRRCVDRCQDISRGMTIIGNEISLGM
jgi:hypothetical protein